MKKQNSFIQEANMKFMSWVLNYDTSDWNIVRKIIHTFSVAEKCFYVACKLNLSYNDRNVAYIAGLLHDLGRFEQWKMYRTYSDHKSVDHADLSFDIIKNSEYFRFSEINDRDLRVILYAVKHHNKEYKGKDKRIKLFNKIVMACDAYSNISLLANGSHMLFTEDNGYTPQIVEDFSLLKPLFNSSPQTKLDRICCLMAGLYYVRFDFLKKELLDNNVIDIIIEEYEKFLNSNDKKVFYKVLKVFKKNYTNPNYKVVL